MLQRRAEHHFDLVAPAWNLLPSKLQLPAVNIFNAHGECDDNDDYDCNIIIFCGRGCSAASSHRVYMDSDGGGLHVIRTVCGVQRVIDMYT